MSNRSPKSMFYCESLWEERKCTFLQKVQDFMKETKMQSNCSQLEIAYVVFIQRISAKTPSSSARVDFQRFRPQDLPKPNLRPATGIMSTAVYIGLERSQFIWAPWPKRSEPWVAKSNHILPVHWLEVLHHILACSTPKPLKESIIFIPPFDVIFYKQKVR